MQSMNAIVSSPMLPQTPATAGRPQPAREAMHPSHAHKSTTEKPDDGLQLGFTDIKPTKGQPSGLSQTTPSKLPTSDTFDFKFAHPAPQLGPEAQRMMDEIREEALRIKAKMAAEKEESRRTGVVDSIHMSGRKIAQPKGRAGRFSDVHMAEFNKMDSIANHPSSFRAQPARQQPPEAKSLKRSGSNAKLDERPSSKGSADGSGRLENTAPAKRARQRVEDDTSSRRPVSRHEETEATAATPSRPRSGLPTSITTPTVSSRAKATFVRKQTTQIPTFTKSASKPNLLSTPRTLTKSATTNNLSKLTKSESSHKFLPPPEKLDSVKSILRRPLDASAKPSSIPALARSPSKPNLGKELPSVPATPRHAENLKAKHVNFTPDVTAKDAAKDVPSQNSPSPMKPHGILKSGIPRAKSSMQLGAGHHRGTSTTTTKSSAMEVDYPTLPVARPLPQPPQQAKAETRKPSIPGEFTFRSEKTIDFGASPTGFGSSPGQASIRAVRQSVAPQSMPGSFPEGNKENVKLLPSVPHGMPNKKRRRVDSDDEGESEMPTPSPKKQKPSVPEGEMLMAPNLINKSSIKSPSKSPTKTPSKVRNFLSMTRLNMLAQPKNRK